MMVIIIIVVVLVLVVSEIHLWLHTVPTFSKWLIFNRVIVESKLISLSVDVGSGSDDVMARLANQDTASMLSFTSSTNATSSSSNYHSQQQQLGTKVGIAFVGQLVVLLVIVRNECCCCCCCCCHSFYQRVSIASHASAGIARAEMSIRLSVTLRYCIKTKTVSVMIFSPSESPNILDSRNIWFITKFDRGHPE